MSNVLIPVDPDKKDDIYYRYKMAPIQVKVESSGNGVKSVIPNIHEICSSLNRPEDVLMKFFQCELGAQSNISVKDDKYLIMGKQTEERMQQLTYDFVRKFVLCTHCKNPETSVILKMKGKSSKLSMLCGACGKTSMMDTGHRAYTIMCQYYIKNPEKARSGKGTAEGRKTENDNEATAAAVPQKVAIKERKAVMSDLHDNRKNPIDLLTQMMKELREERVRNEGADEDKNGSVAVVTEAVVEQLTTHVVRLQTEFNLQEHFTARLVLISVINQNPDRCVASIRMYAPLLRRFATPAELFFRQDTFDEQTLSALLKREERIQKIIITEMAIHISKAPIGGVPPQEKMTVLLFLLFVEGILKDTSIINYINTEKAVLNVGEELDKAMKANAVVLKNWLQVGETRMEEATIVAQ